MTQEAAQWSQWLPEVPRLIHAQLSRPDLSAAMLAELQRSRQAREQGNRLLVALTGVVAVALGVALWALIR